MKVLLLAPHPYYIDRGTPIDVDLVVRVLSERGVSVDVATYHQGRDVDYANVRILRIRAPRWIKNVPPGLSVRKLICDVLLFRLATRLTRRIPYDVVHAGEEAVFMAMWLKRRHGLPYIYDMDSSIAQQVVEQRPYLRPLAGLFNALEARAIRGSTAAAPVCNALADLARERGAPHVETLHDISRLADHDFNATGHVRATLGCEGPIVMYVGNLQPYQGVDLLLESAALALREEPTLNLVIAGGPPERIEAYRKKADQLGLEGAAHFVGHWPAERLGELLAEADILVAPRTRGINTPMKVFPYLHSGRPVLVTDLMTHRQVLDESVVMLAPPEPAAFGAAIVRLLRDEALRARLGAAGRKFVQQRHTYEAHARRLNRLYDHVTTQWAARPAPVGSAALPESRG